jgi:hypothetical protein
MVVLTACPNDPAKIENTYDRISFMGTSVSFPLNTNTTDYAVYINQTQTQLTNLNFSGELTDFKGQSSGGTLTPDITKTRDYSQPKTFTYTPSGGTAREIIISAFRKPTATESSAIVQLNEILSYVFSIFAG